MKPTIGLNLHSFFVKAHHLHGLQHSVLQQRRRSNAQKCHAQWVLQAAGEARVQRTDIFCLLVWNLFYCYMDFHLSTIEDINWLVVWNIFPDMYIYIYVYIYIYYIYIYIY